MALYKDNIANGKCGSMVVPPKGTKRKQERRREKGGEFVRKREDERQKESNG